jgi:hypothetical protein
VKKLDGKLELIGGTDEDRTAAREWISMFMHEAGGAGAALNRLFRERTSLNYKPALCSAVLA